MSRLPLLIIITGLPGTGKTTFANRLAKTLGLPCISRDVLKEALFQGLGIGDRDWSQRVGGASYEVLYTVAQALLMAQNSFILESNFNRDEVSERMQHIYEHSPFMLVQIVCTVEESVRVQRIVTRAKSGERHPGHVDPVDPQQVHTPRSTDPNDLIVHGIPSQTFMFDPVQLTEREAMLFDDRMRVALVAR